MPTGTVKFFNMARGYGFIEPDGGGNDIFVHVSALNRSGITHLSQGDRVSFDIETDQRSGRTSAENVRKT